MHAMVGSFKAAQKRLEECVAFTRQETWTVSLHLCTAGGIVIDDHKRTACLPII